MTSREHFEIAETHYYEYEETQNEELLEKALKSYSEAIKLQPGFADAYYKRALIYGIYKEYHNQYQDLNMVINVYSDLIEHDGDNPELHYNLALIHMAKCGELEWWLTMSILKILWSGKDRTY